MVNINIDKYEVVASGSVVIHESKNVVFDVDGLNITFSFNNDGGERVFKTEKTGDVSLSIICENFDNEGWVGNVDMLRVGTIKGAPLYVKFRTNFVSKDVVLFYTWYKEK